ncbi:MAG: cytochrome P450 [Pseudomonadales bacterium]|nr:cytochrome P450 [Pseudomonadales bacterium]
MSTITEKLIKKAERDPRNMYGRDAYSIDLKDYDIAQSALFHTNTFWSFFDRMRKEAPVHFCPDSMENGPYWSVTKYKDIMEVESRPDLYSSEDGGVSIRRRMEKVDRPSFISMDEPEHGKQRIAVQGVVAPSNLAVLEPIIRERCASILDSLPLNETFNWVDKVSIELTTQMLATLFDFPFEERSKLTYWSDIATSNPDIDGMVSSDEERERILWEECLPAFTKLWNERVNAEPSFDLISMLAHGENTRNMDPATFLGNLTLLIVGGNDTTRNSISGSVLALNEFPDQYDKLRANPDLVTTLVPEIIRWQTPLTHMARTALVDTTLGGKQINKGDRVVMWYVSGNRDEEMIDQPYEFIIDRKKPRQHLSFGFGIHRCMGNRLAEMQLRVIWEEILKRFDKIEVVGTPERNKSTFIKGFSNLPVRLHPVNK